MFNFDNKNDGIYVNKKNCFKQNEREKDNSHTPCVGRAYRYKVAHTMARWQKRAALQYTVEHV